MVATTWTLGGDIGQQTLTATVANVTPATVNAQVTIGPLTTLNATTTANQFVVIGGTVASPPAIRATDAFGNPIAGQAIVFADPTGRSTLVRATATTDADGRAGVAAWTVGTAPGAYSVVASAGPSVAAGFSAFAHPAVIQIAGGNNQTANAGTQLDLPAVQALGPQNEPVAGVVVTFAVTGGGGRLLGTTTALTGVDGVARGASWILGDVPGTNTATALVNGLPLLEFTATGSRPSRPSSLPPPRPRSRASKATTGRSVRPSDSSTRPASRLPAGPLSSRPQGRHARWHQRHHRLQRRGSTAKLAVRVRSADGGGHRSRPSAGRLRCGDRSGTSLRILDHGPVPRRHSDGWTAGRLRARGSEVELNSPGRPRAGAVHARRQHEQLRRTTLDETIDDLLIFARIQRIDGPGGILGQARPCYVRTGSFHTIVGYMEFDADDAVALETSGNFDNVVLHEMGHVIGIGSLWSFQGLAADLTTGDPYFVGPSAQMAFAAALTTYLGQAVPIENTGGAGTRGGHWRESVLANELMTGFLNTGVNPLSAITTASLRDQGYLVSDAAADPFSLNAAIRALNTPAFELHTAIEPVILRSKDRNGVVRVVPTGRGPVRSGSSR